VRTLGGWPSRQRFHFSDHDAQAVTRETKRQLLLEFPGQAGEARQFWQARFYDFNVFTEKKKIEKLEYMRGNPVTRGLVAHPKDWPWNGNGLIPVDLM
jgi:hypothetical protein